MDSVDGFINVIGKISTLIGFGKQLESIFGGSAALTMADIETAIKKDLAEALQAQSLESQILDASATLSAVQKFLSIEYLQAVAAGMDDAGLYGVLTNPTIGDHVATMQDHVQALQEWMNQLTDVRTAAKAIPVSLGLYLYTSIIYREQAKRVDTVRDGGTAQRAALGTMRGYARSGVQDIGPRLINLINTRLADLVYLSDDNPNVTDVGGIPIKQYCTIDSLHDSWIDTWLFAFKAHNDATMDYAGALHWVMRASENLLWSGTQADADEFSRSLTDGWLRVPGSLGQGDTPWAENFRDTCLIPNTKLGAFVQSARTALLGLDAIAFGYLGSEQDDWSWCTSCGGLYFAGAASVCPASGGPHVHEQPSGNYVLRCSPTGPAPRYMSDNWLWCKKCSGLFKNWGTRLCPAGGAHDSAGSSPYQLDVGAIPGLDVRGLVDAQDNWRWCGKCSALHYGSGPSVCPAGGAHDSGGSENYWLSVLGTLPQSS